MSDLLPSAEQKLFLARSCDHTAESNAREELAAADGKAGDVVFLRRKWRHYLLHLVLQVDGDRFLIGNNLRTVDGWADAADILGRVEHVGEGEAPSEPRTGTTQLSSSGGR